MRNFAVQVTSKFVEFIFIFNCVIFFLLSNCVCGCVCRLSLLEHLIKYNLCLPSMRCLYIQPSFHHIEVQQQTNGHNGCIDQRVMNKFQ